MAKQQIKSLSRRNVRTRAWRLAIRWSSFGGQLELFRRDTNGFKKGMRQETRVRRFVAMFAETYRSPSMFLARETNEEQRVIPSGCILRVHASLFVCPPFVRRPCHESVICTLAHPPIVFQCLATKKIPKNPARRRRRA